MATTDETMGDIEAAMALQHSGDLDDARLRLTEIWEAIASDGDPFHRCVLAHYMADLQPDPRDELVSRTLTSSFAPGRRSQCSAGIRRRAGGAATLR